jgi:hypothetical protein
MPAESEARPIIVVPVEACPLTEQRMTAIRTYHPAGAYHVPAEQHPLGMQISHWSLPQQSNSHRLRSLDHDAVQHSPAHSDAVTVGETRLHAQIAADETDSSEGMGDLGWNPDSQLFQRCATIGHQAFTARFVDRRLSPVCHHYLETALTRRDGRSQTSGPAANYENICCFHHDSNDEPRSQRPGRQPVMFSSLLPAPTPDDKLSSSSGNSTGSVELTIAALDQTLIALRARPRASDQNEPE